MSLRMSDSPSMYGLPHQNQGPPPPPHHSHQHSHSSSHSHHDRYRGRGSSASSGGPPGPGGASDIKSPVMASLRPSPLEERNVRERDPGPGMNSRPRGPHAGASTSGPGMPPGSSLASLPATVIGPGRPQDSVAQSLLGPGHHPSALPKERERERGMERAPERERDRRSSGAGVQGSPGSARREREYQHREKEAERERQIKERERMERHAQQQEREREMRAREARRDSQREQDFRQHAHEMMGLTAIERDDREREWLNSQQAQAQQTPGHLNMRVPPQPQPQPLHVMGPPQGEVWTRIVPPRTGPPTDGPRMMRDHEREMERSRGYEEMRTELVWDPERVERSQRSSKSRPSTKEAQDRGDQPKVTQREERKSRTSASQREKERVAKEREKAKMEAAAAAAAAREKEREKAREHEFRMHEQQLALAKEAQYEIMERERRQREMQEMEAIRAARARESQGPPPGAPHHHHHHQSFPPSGQPYPGPQPPSRSRASSSKQAPMGTPGVAHIPSPADVPPQYAAEQDPQFRQGSSRSAGQSSISHIVPVQHQQAPPHLVGHHPGPHPHQMGPGPHLRQHPADMYGPGGPLGYPSRRPSPPPFHPAPPPPAAASFVFPRSTTPPPTLILPIRHLGIYIHPRTPFPFLDFPGPINETGAPSDPVDIRATIYIPSSFIPSHRPARPRIWGGGLIPAVPPLTGGQRQLVQQFSGGHPGYGRPEPMEIRDGRRVYTDDSDLFLCALHSGWVSWSMARRARRERKDLRLEVRLTREARYVGGLGSPLRMRDVESDESSGSDDDGSSLLSSGWGNSHDGSGIEILKAEFVAPGTAHSFGLRNRSQRLLEYAERRCALGCVPRSSRKRRRLHAFSPIDTPESALQLSFDRADDELSATRIMVFGTDSSWPEIGFKYHPDALREVLFPRSGSDSRPSKRRKLGSSAEQSASEPPTDAGSDDGLSQQRAVVVETLWESFLISQRGQIPAGDGESDKENAGDDAESSSTSGNRRYTIALITNAGGTAGKLSRARKALGGAEPSVAASEAEPSEPKINGSHTGDSAEPPNSTPAKPAVLTDGTSSSVAERGATAASAVSLPAAPENGDATHETTPAPSKTSDDLTDDGNGPIQILHRNLGEENFEFLPDGISILSTEVSNGLRKGWKLEAQMWKWVQVGVSG
ncbi:hypothetical protein GY45DRAFT_1248347 [Cubamyces sp. BRFM 1775]|nr:hypothetical protein GY45DRAFT_1248347 [Cubamyces sp. BRFM 1775]